MIDAIKMVGVMVHYGGSWYTAKGIIIEKVWRWKRYMWAEGGVENSNE